MTLHNPVKADLLCYRAPYPVQRQWAFNNLQSTAISITDIAGTQIAQTMSNSYAAGGIGHSITMRNTQSNALTAMVIDLGTASVAHTGLKIKCYGASSTQYGIVIDPSTTGTGYGIHFLNYGGSNNRCINIAQVGQGSYSNYGLYIGEICTSSMGINFSAIDASGYGIYMSSVSGEGIVIRTMNDNTSRIIRSDNNISSSDLVARTIDYNLIYVNRTSTASSGTVADNYNLFKYYRTNTMNHSGGTLTVAGTVMWLENVSTQTAGTLTDAVDVLYTKQSSSITTGRLIVGVVGSTERFLVNPGVAASGTAIAYKLDCANTLGTTDKLLSVQNAGAEKFYVDNAGLNYAVSSSTGSSTPAAISSTGVLTVTNTTAATNTVTGGAIFSCGVGVAGSLYAAALYDNGVRAVSSAGSTGGTTTPNGTVDVLIGGATVHLLTAAAA